MEDVAAAAGVSAATAYNHFPTRHALLGHVYAPLIRPLAVQAERDIAAGRSMVEALTDQVKALCRTAFRYRQLTSAFWSAVQEYTIRVEGPPDAGDDVDPRTLAPIPTSLRLLMEHGQNSGELRAFPAAGEMSEIVVRVFLMHRVNHPHESPEVTAELLLTVMFGSLRPDLLVIGERPFRGAR